MKHYSVEAFIAQQNGTAADDNKGSDTTLPDITTLKARADELGVTYADTIGAKKLAERIAAKEKELADGDGDAKNKTGGTGADGATQS